MGKEFLDVTYDKFVFKVKVGNLYPPEECWVRKEGEVVIVGVTDVLQRTVGDIAFLELPEAGKEVERESETGTMETIKTTVALISPVGGTIKEVNGQLEDNPQMVNTDPYGEGWLFKVAPRDWEEDKKFLVDAATYFPIMEEKIKKEMAKK